MATPTVLAPPVRMPAAPAPRPETPKEMPNAWFMPTAWVLLVMVPTVWILSQNPRSVLPDAMPIWPLQVAVVALWLCSAQLVYVDAKNLDLGRLKLARIKLTASERTTPADWCLWVLVFWYLGFPWYMAVRRKNWGWALWAERIGEFGNKKELRSALRANPGVSHGQPIPW
ncbi:MAG TPA: hypothetical protein VI818_06045 [Candidatus Thermoplasmatota archaeon]|nr:hypothetical protein [Candidatus Thermoplasmatota archaeon]